MDEACLSGSALMAIGLGYKPAPLALSARVAAQLVESGIQLAR